MSTAYNTPYSGPSRNLAEYGAQHFPSKASSYTRTTYAPLRKEPVQAAWRFSVMIGAMYLWLFQLPFSLALWASPNFLKGYVYQAAHFVYEWTLPAVHLTEDTTYAFFKFIDTLWDRGLRSAMNTHTNNVQHFKVALEAYLRLIQHKAEVIERHGLRGIPMAFSATAA